MLMRIVMRQQMSSFHVLHPICRPVLGGCEEALQNRVLLATLSISSEDAL